MYFATSNPRLSDCIEKFAARQAPPLDAVGNEPASGWVTGRHLLDRNITSETATYAGFLRLALVKIEKRVPEALLRAECKMEELAQLAATGNERLLQSERAAIRKSVSDRLQPQAQPTIRGIPLVVCGSTDMAYAGAMSAAQQDALMLSIVQTVGACPLVAIMPDTAASLLCKVKPGDLQPIIFSDRHAPSEVCLGPEFLTWLWFFGEAKGGLFDFSGTGRMAVQIEGPLVFDGGADGQQMSIRRGEPLLSAEAKAALQSGKLLRKAKLTLAIGDAIWNCTLDAADFGIRGLKLPEGEKLDQASRFQDRMERIYQFWQMLIVGAYAKFVAERSSPEIWVKTESEIREWIQQRRVR